MLQGKQVRVTPNRSGLGDIPQFGATYIQGRSGPLHVLAADVNEDGFDEAIVTGTATARIYNLSDGTSNVITGSSGAFMSAMADLDGDGSQELVVVGNNTAVKVYTVGADGSTGSPMIFLNPDETTYQTVVVADFDFDGRDDLAVTNFSTGSVHILREIGGLGLELWARIDGVSSFTSVKPAAMDLNSDGLMDLVIGDISNDQILLYQNNNDGTFSQVDTITSQSPYWLIAKDIDHDGNMDLVSTTQSRYLNIYFFDNAGHVDQWVELEGVYQMVEVVAEDFAGDSLLDLSVATSGTGPANGPPPLVWEQTSPRVFEIVAALPTNSAPGIAATDVNHDGAMDILTVSNDDRSLMIHWGTPEACLADLTGEGMVDCFDVSAFLQAFGAQEALADFTNDGIWDFFDVSAFLQAYAQGCP